MEISKQRDGITPRQKGVVDKIDEMIRQQGFSPTYAEIAAELDTTAPNIGMIVNALQDRGWLTILEGRPRSISIIKQEKEHVSES